MAAAPTPHACVHRFRFLPLPHCAAQAPSLPPENSFTMICPRFKVSSCVHLRWAHEEVNTISTRVGLHAAAKSTNRALRDPPASIHYAGHNPCQAAGGGREGGAAPTHQAKPFTGSTTPQRDVTWLHLSGEMVYDSSRGAAGEGQHMPCAVPRQ